MQFFEFTEALRRRLQEPLPGLSAQLKMAPMDRRVNVKRFNVPEDARQSAVLILLYPGQKGGIYLPIQERTAYDGVHSRQMGLPGGGVEDEDADFETTALRETEEEIGIQRQEIELLGRLSPLYIPPSNYFVQPVVGRLEGTPRFRLDPTEVAALYEAPITAFTGPDSVGTSQIPFRDGKPREVPRFMVSDRIVWGATAMMMGEFRELVLELEGK